MLHTVCIKAGKLSFSVIRKVPEHDLLVWNVKDGWGPLCQASFTQEITIFWLYELHDFNKILCETLKVSKQTNTSMSDPTRQQNRH